MVRTEKKIYCFEDHKQDNVFWRFFQFVAVCFNKGHKKFHIYKIRLEKLVLTRHQNKLKYEAHYNKYALNFYGLRLC
jgi:hypothetical protein